MNETDVVVKTILSADGLLKIEIFRRPDGTYGFEGYWCSHEPREPRWTPYGFGGHRAADATIAENEAVARMKWSTVLDGMTVNERLYALGLLEEFDAARAAKDVEKLTAILMRARLDRVSIQANIDSL